MRGPQVPHEHAPLSAREAAVLMAIERGLDDRIGPDPPRGAWAWQLAGVTLVAVCTLLATGLRHADPHPLVVVESVAGLAGVVLGGVLAVDRARRWVLGLRPLGRWRTWRLERRARRFPTGGSGGRVRRTGARVVPLARRGSRR
ncbi:MAG: hypothetical protein KDB40_13525 [Acidimicrobiales bacterium]|nr:hypothetical protein [Acidimicrobiales bacterium]MCB9396044.1 hypothetical protein [Acidimicrobiaceae bacterium]